MDWAPWAYQYGVGLLILVVGVVAGFRNGVWTSEKKGWLLVVVGGWLAMGVVQGVFQYWGTAP